MIELRVAALLADPAVFALVGNRVYPVIAPQDAVSPFVVWQRVSSVVDDTHDSDTTQQPAIQVSCYARRFADVVELRDAVVATIIPGDATGPMYLRNVRDSHEHDAGLFRSDVDFEIFHS